MIVILAETILWTSLLWIFYIYAGYPIILYLTNSKQSRLTPPPPKPLPKVSVFVPAFNEESIIEKKILSTLNSNYPPKKIQIVVASDASTDKTDEIVRSIHDSRVKLLSAEENIGKNALINRFIDDCDGELIVFTDANAIFDKEAISRLVRWFTREDIHCVGGRLIYLVGDSLTAKGEGAYYKYENKIRELEARKGNLMGVNGALYMIRKSAFQSLPNHVPNDFFHPLCVLASGKRVFFDPSATASEKATVDAKDEFQRRSRIVTRALATYDEVKSRVGPLRGEVLFNYLSHRFLRWYGFIPISAATLSSSFLFFNHVGSTYRIVFAAIVALGISSLLGTISKKLGLKIKLLEIPYYFVLINLAAMIGVWNYSIGKQVKTWKPAESTR